MTTTSIPVTVGTFDTRQKHEGPNVATVTSMVAFSHQKRRQLGSVATTRGCIPVTLGTLKSIGGAVTHQKRQNDNSYEDGDLKGLHPCGCWHF